MVQENDISQVSCFVVDDEHFAIDLLQSYIAKTPSLLLLGTCSDAQEAIGKILQLEPQVLFLDIQMPLFSGFALLNQLSYTPQIVFTTAYKQFASDAYDVNAIDYLLKPFSYQRFLQSIQKVLVAIPFIQAQTSQKHIAIRVNRTTMKLDIDSILYVEKVTDYVYIYTTTDKYLALYTLQKIEEILHGCNFLRIHKSYLVALKKIDKWNVNHVYIQFHSLPIARARKQDIIQELNKSVSSLQGSLKL